MKRCQPFQNPKLVLVAHVRDGADSQDQYVMTASEAEEFTLPWSVGAERLSNPTNIGIQSSSGASQTSGLLHQLPRAHVSQVFEALDYRFFLQMSTRSDTSTTSSLYAKYNSSS